MYKITLRSPAAFKLILIVLLGAAAVFFSKEVSGGINEGIYFCVSVLVPSVFPFMIISSLTAKINLGFSGRKINKISNSLFGLSAKTVFTVLIGIIGGYPVAAKGISSLYKNGSISEKEAAKAAYIAVGAGPGFLITYVGVRLLNSYEAGAALLVSQITSVIIIGIINRFIFGKGIYNSKKEISVEPSAFEIFISSVKSAVYAIIEMCAIVCVFSAVIKVIEKYSGGNDLVNILLEVSRACYFLSENGSIVPIAFAVGFGGICVHIQIFQALGTIRIKKWLFFLYRIIQGGITAALTYLICKVFNITIPVFSSIRGDFTLSLSGSVVGSSLLILTGICFLFSIKNN